MPTLTSIVSHAIKRAYSGVTPAFRNSTGHEDMPTFATSDEIVKAIENGAIFDLVLATRPALAALASRGLIETPIDLAVSSIGAAILSGSAHPEISTIAGLTDTLLGARTIAFTTGPSGRHLMELIRRLELEERLVDKIRFFDGKTVGLSVARGDADIAFTQISELLAVEGIEVLANLAPEAQQNITISGSIHSAAPARWAAEAFLAFFAGSSARTILENSGLKPVEPS